MSNNYFDGIQEDIKNLSDTNLIELIRAGNDDAMDFLVYKYKNLVRCKARPYFLIGAAHEDVVQEGMIGLFKAIRDYNRDSGSSFKTFAELCITRQILSAIKHANRKKHNPLNTYISLSGSSDDEDRDMEQQLGNAIDNNPETLFINRENLEIIEQKITGSLSKMEFNVFKLYIKGLSYTEISEHLGKPVKSIDNAVQRIKNKLYKLLIQK